MRSSEFVVSRSARVFIAIVVLEALLLMIDQTAVSPPASDDQESKWWLGIMFIQLAFFVYFAVSAVLKENKWELYTFQAASFLGVFRVVSTYSWRNDHCEEIGLLPWCITIVVIVVISQFLFVFFGYYIGKNMGWKFFKQVGSDAHLKSMWSTYQGFQSVLKIDVLLAILQVFTVLFYSSDDSFSAGIIVGSVMLVWEALWEYLGYWSVRKEHKVGFIIFLVIGCLSPAYSVLFLTHFSSLHSGISVTSPFFKVLILLILVVINRIALTVFGLMCLKNFDKGLRTRLFEKQPDEDTRRSGANVREAQESIGERRESELPEHSRSISPSVSDLSSYGRSVSPSSVAPSVSDDFSLRSSADSFADSSRRPSGDSTVGSLA